MSRQSHHETLQTWSEALKAYDEQDLDTALDRLMSIPDPSSFLLYNLGIVYFSKDLLNAAILCMREAVVKDERFHLGFYRLGCLFYEVKKYDEAIQSFERCEACFRENKLIDYEQLGLKCRLALWQVIYNSALAWGMSGNSSKSIVLLVRARTEKGSKPDDVIDRTLRALQQPLLDFSQFSMILPPKKDLLFRPHASLQVGEKIDFLGKPKVIAETKESTLLELKPKERSGFVKSQLFDVNLENLKIPMPLNDPPPRNPSIPGALSSHLFQVTGLSIPPPTSPPPRY